MPFKPKIKRILVIKSRAIGDTILVTGPLRVLRRYKPDHQIHVLVRSPAGELLEGLPYVDRIISAKEPPGKIDRLAYWMRLIRRLRAKRYDLVLNFHASFRSSLTGQLMRKETCVTNHHELNGRNWFSDLPVPGRGQVKSIIDRDLDLLRAIGVIATVEEAMPEIVITPAERAEAAAIFDANPNKARGPRVFLGIGGSRETKRWPPEHVAALARRLAVDFDAQLVLSTIKADRAWLERFWPHIQADPIFVGRIRHFSGLSLRSTAKIMSQCRFYIGNDSGLKHLAVALGLHTFTFFGPEAPLEWHPYDRKYHPYAFTDSLACRTESGQHWCSVPVCEKYGHQCMQGLVPDAVWGDVARIVRASGASGAFL